MNGAPAVRVPATTANLGPGFDAFGAAVALHLVARAVPRDDGPRVRSAGEGSDLPDGDDNLLWRAYLALHAHLGDPVADVAIEVTSAIPLERGLGSSSAAIVAGLGLARAVTGAAVADRELVRLAAEVEGHPDNVAPAVLGGLVVAARTDAGGLVLRRTSPHARLRPLVLVPRRRQATSAARGLLPTTLRQQEVIDQAARAGHVVAALSGLWPADPALAGDRLHEPARAAAMPDSARLLGALRERGSHAWLSGAGPSIAVALPRRGDPGAVEALAGAHGFDAHHLDWDLGGLVSHP